MRRERFRVLHKASTHTYAGGPSVKISPCPQLLTYDPRYVKSWVNPHAEEADIHARFGVARRACLRRQLSIRSIERRQWVFGQEHLLRLLSQRHARTANC